MMEFGYIKINGVDLKQLFYGIDESNLPINSKAPIYNSVVSDFSCSNELTYTEEPSRDLSGNLHNTEIPTFYVPTVKFILNYINIEVYSRLIKTINTPSFEVTYYDYELLKTVTRTMYTSEKSMNALHMIGKKLASGDYIGDIKGVQGVELTFVSRYGYNTYNDL